MIGSDMSSVAVIPARGGSKRVPRKNVRLLNGRPVLAWTIEICRESGLFDRVVVSTDDDEVAAIALAEGAEVPFRRAPELSDDVTPLVPVVSDAIVRLGLSGARHTAVCCVYATAIGLRPHDLAGGQDLLAERTSGAEPDYVIGVVRYAHPIQRALTRDPAGGLRMVDPQTVNVRTQDLEPRWYDAGQFTWGWVPAWLDQLPILTHARGYELPAWRTVDLDDESDWDRAQILHPIIRRVPLG